MPSSSKGTDPNAERKRAAAEHAVRFLTPGRIVGVGSGSTVACFIEALAARRADFARAVSSSERSTQLLRKAGIEVLDLNDAGPIDVYVDGADEVDPALALIKGGGGALTREKIIAQASRKFVCIVDESKEVPVLGRFALPVEVIPMARSLVERQLQGIGATVKLREGFITDNGNLILDAAGLHIDDPLDLEARINQWPGVVTVGLFARRRADVLLVAGAAGVIEKTGNRVQDDGGT
jgi:ribose 5-phosphate isomerase A